MTIKSFNTSNALWVRLLFILALAACYYALEAVTGSLLPFKSSPNWFNQIVVSDRYNQPLYPNEQFNRFAALLWTSFRRAVISLLVALPIGLVIRMLFKNMVIIIACFVGLLRLIYVELTWYNNLLQASILNNFADYIKSKFEPPDNIPGVVILFSYIISIGSVPLMTWISGRFLKKQNGAIPDDKFIQNKT